MSDWRKWNLQAWNERLLGHFFRSNEERPSPVVVLLVTSEELARSTGDARAGADEARDAFVDAVRSGIGRSRSLLEDASDYRDWPGPPRWEPPRFVAHLLFTCIAASESSDEMADEGSFVLRLRELTRDQLPENSLQLLPRLWEHLAVWLATNEGRYRPLVLPGPGGLTRIGYTVKLAFPDRRDQRELSDLLDRAGLAGHEPPVGRVLSLVGSERNRFRRSFLVAFDEFRRAFESNGHGKSTGRLADHRFWAAVREASLRGRGQLEMLSNVPARWSLLAEEEEERIALFAVSDERAENDAVSVADLPVAYGPWRFAVLPRGTDAIDANLLEQVSQRILDGSLRLPRLSSYVEQGLLPFVAASHGLLELARQEQLAEVAVALVRSDLRDDVLRFFSGPRTSMRSSSYEGWIQFFSPRLRTLSESEIDGTSLNQTWVLQDSLRPIHSRTVGGIRVDDGWLGAREVLPRIVAPGATAVVLEIGVRRIELAKIDGSDQWTLPPEDLVGECTLVAMLDGFEERRAMRFHATPASEAFKAASDPDAWIIEEIAGTGTLSGTTPFAPVMDDSDCQALCERQALLGRDVGAFVTTAEAAAWKITHFGDKYFGSLGSIQGEASIPLQQVSNANARRRWRRMLFDSASDPSDPIFTEARRKVRVGASTHLRLPRIEIEQSIPDLAPSRLSSSPSQAVGRLVRIVAGRAASRSGIEWKEWCELLERVVDVDRSLRERVTRAWMEAGLIDVASFARWWHRKVFARTPRLIAYKIGERFGATLSGLSLPTSVDAIRRAAARAGLLVEDRFSVSPLVPSTISVRSPDRRALDTIASSCHVELRWLDVAGLKTFGSSRHDGMSDPPQHYDHSTRWPRWSLRAGEFTAVTVEHHMRRDRPDYWVASREGRRVWFYDLNLTRAWAAVLLGEPIVSAVENGFLDAGHAFLPLPISRAVSVLGFGLPGPFNATYRYAVGSPILRQMTLDIVGRAFDPSRLVASATRQTG